MLEKKSVLKDGNGVVLGVVSKKEIDAATHKYFKLNDKFVKSQNNVRVEVFSQIETLDLNESLKITKDLNNLAGISKLKEIKKGITKKESVLGVEVRTTAKYEFQATFKEGLKEIHNQDLKKAVINMNNGSYVASCKLDVLCVYSLYCAYIENSNKYAYQLEKTYKTHNGKEWTEIIFTFTVGAPFLSYDDTFKFQSQLNKSNSNVWEKLCSNSITRAESGEKVADYIARKEKELSSEIEKFILLKEDTKAAIDSFNNRNKVDNE